MQWKMEEGSGKCRMMLNSGALDDDLQITSPLDLALPVPFHNIYVHIFKEIMMIICACTVSYIITARTYHSITMVDDGSKIDVNSFFSSRASSCWWSPFIAIVAETRVRSFVPVEQNKMIIIIIRR